jgi:lipopolysaccharide exporter
VRSAIGRGASWMVLLRLCDRVVGLASTIVLARLLTPADFGLVAMAMSVIAVIELTTAFGFDVALIQKPTLERRDFDSAWTLSIILYCSCAVVIGLVSIPAAIFYGDPRLVNVMLFIGVGWIFSGLENSRIVEFRRRMDFAKEFVFSVSKRLVGFIVTITAAIVLQNYWALIIGMVTGRAAGFALSYLMIPCWPRIDLSSAGDLLKFSRWLLVNNAMLISVVRFPHFLIGKILGPQALGLFTVAYDIATLPATELSSPVNRAALPGYSSMASDQIKLKETFLDVGAVVVAVALPASAGLAMIAEPLVRVVLGENWLEAVPIIRILAISAALVAATGNNGVAHLAVGYPKAVTLQSLLRLAVLIALGVTLAPAFGSVGVAVAELCGAAVCLIASYPVIFRHLGISVVEYGRRMWRSVVATVGMATVIAIAEANLPGGHDVTSALFSLAILVPTGAVTYVVLMFAMWHLCGKPDGAERTLFNQCSGIVGIYRSTFLGRRPSRAQ